MNVTEAVLKRRSIRAYLPNPVPDDVIQDILDKAIWSPSATNAQAWSLEVVTGTRKEELSRSLFAAWQAGERWRSDLPMPQFEERLRERRRTLGYRIYDAKGIPRQDKQKRAEWYQEMLGFFRAPAALVVHTPAYLAPYILPDMGLFAMAIMLLATERGLGTCPMFATLDYSDIVKAVLAIPKEHMLVMGIALGYPDESDPVNNFSREREPVSSFTRFHR